MSDRITSLRQRLEAVLRDHNWSHVPYCSTLLDDLCAVLEDARPQPSREALPSILGGHCSTVILSEQLYDKLMTWARGEPEPTKCKACGQDIPRSQEPT